MIRRATPDDVPELIRLGAAMHAESPFWGRFAFSEERLAETLYALLGTPRGFVWIAEVGEEIVGALLGMVEQHWMSSDLMATELAFYVRSDVRGGLHGPRLLAAFVAWTDAVGARATFAGLSSGIDSRAGRLYVDFAGFVHRPDLMAFERVA